jgi:hypothetical protein
MALFNHRRNLRPGEHEFKARISPTRCDSPFVQQRLSECEILVPEKKVFQVNPKTPVRASRNATNGMNKTEVIPTKKLDQERWRLE